MSKRGHLGPKLHRSSELLLEDDFTQPLGLTSYILIGLKLVVVLAVIFATYKTLDSIAAFSSTYTTTLASGLE